MKPEPKEEKQTDSSGGYLFESEFDKPEPKDTIKEKTTYYFQTEFEETAEEKIENQSIMGVQTFNLYFSMCCSRVGLIFIQCSD